MVKKTPTNVDEEIGPRRGQRTIAKDRTAIYNESIGPRQELVKDDDPIYEEIPSLYDMCTLLAEQQIDKCGEIQPFITNDEQSHILEAAATYDRENSYVRYNGDNG